MEDAAAGDGLQVSWPRVWADGSGIPAVSGTSARWFAVTTQALSTAVSGMPASSSTPSSSSSPVPYGGTAHCLLVLAELLQWTRAVRTAGRTPVPRPNHG